MAARTCFIAVLALALLLPGANSRAEPAPTASSGMSDGRPHVGDVFAGPARIIDGDTLVIGGQPIRLFGIDTPERGQPGFDSATLALRNRTGSGDREQAVTCITVDVDRYRRAVALCRIGDPSTVREQQETLSEMMLRSCHARRLSRWNHRVNATMRARLDRASADCG